MNARALLLLLLLAAGPAAAQGFAGLGRDAEGFALPERGRALEFPADHGPHWDFRIEWWYLTAVLEAPDGRLHGVQWTLFRAALAPEEGAGWAAPQLWMGHAGLTTPDRHFHAERLARGGIGQAGVEPAPFRAWIDDWHMTGTAGPGEDELARLTLAARGTDFSYELRLVAEGPLVAQGEGGYSVKSAAGQASHYYSQPFYRAEGVLHLPEGALPVTGLAWLDREWSSQPLAPDQTGWDWFSLHFDSGEKLMGFRLRDAGEGFTSATWIAADGTPDPQAPGALRLTPLATATVAGRKVPVRWRLELPARGLDITAEAVNPGSWMDTLFPYWEGPVIARGSHPGLGYLEMTGYEAAADLAR
jgi:predicted secreted hydrolase